MAAETDCKEHKKDNRVRHSLSATSSDVRLFRPRTQLRELDQRACEDGGSTRAWLETAPARHRTRHACRARKTRGTETPRNVTALAGHTVRLYCPVADTPSRASLGKKNHRQRSFPNGTLVVTQVQRSQDTGWYECTARDTQGNTARGQLVLRVMNTVVEGAGNSDHLGFFNVHPNLSTQVHSVSASIRMQPPQPEFDPATCGSAAEYLSH
ncbi:hypothetical protein HPB51_028996 [Rhipicephalus microplus]|uniref:Ig-like domain-containing protein n=1 Tax=Rhipicephalus microplus TaxID=6941 RepID=A0A9J6CVT3_RHIMP|nr:hypothetical protein HPB51_028996 [Rhipicephalus microplus]